MTAVWATTAEHSATCLLILLGVIPVGGPLIKVSAYILLQFIVVAFIANQRWLYEDKKHQGLWKPCGALDWEK